VALPPFFTFLKDTAQNVDIRGPRGLKTGSVDPLLFNIVNGIIARPRLFIASVACAKLVSPESLERDVQSADYIFRFSLTKHESLPSHILQRIEFVQNR
jgi:hypothetical protein